MDRIQYYLFCSSWYMHQLLFCESLRTDVERIKDLAVDSAKKLHFLLLRALLSPDVRTASQCSFSLASGHIARFVFMQFIILIVSASSYDVSWRIMEVDGQFY